MSDLRDAVTRAIYQCITGEELPGSERGHIWCLRHDKLYNRCPCEVGSLTRHRTRYIDFEERIARFKETGR